MTPEVLLELHKLRNELAHGKEFPDADSLAHRLKATGLSVPVSELHSLMPVLLRGFGFHEGQVIVPPFLLDVMAGLLNGHPAQFVCDPCAGLGMVISAVQETTHAANSLAVVRTQQEAVIGRALSRSVDWQVGDPLQVLAHLSREIDVAASILPFGSRSANPITLVNETGDTIELAGDLGELVLASACHRLSNDGVGLFVVAASFFSSSKSVFRRLEEFGIGVEAALALPRGTFAPNSGIATYLVVVRKRSIRRMFVAQLSKDSKTNSQVVANLKHGRTSGNIDLGQFASPREFYGLDALRFAVRMAETQTEFGVPAVRLGEFTTAVRLGKADPGFSFPKEQNAIFVPLIGISDVVDSMGDLSLKDQNYAQIVIDPSRSDARFVAQFLNSELGRETRGSLKAGFIPKLNKRSLKELYIFVPDLQTQLSMLEVEGKIVSEENTLSGLQNELRDLRRNLWANPRTVDDVDRRVQDLSRRLTKGLKQHADIGLDQWTETLPFPLASILRTWLATPSRDAKTKYEHLLHFFEGTAEFLSTILLSAFGSQEVTFETHKERLTEACKKQNLSFRRSTFGTWKLVVEYLAKQIRLLLSGDENSRALCKEMFADDTLTLPKMLGRTELAEVLSVTNKMRNDWAGHGGVVSQAEALLRHEQLVKQAQRLRDVMADAWSDTQLIHALNVRPRREGVENEVAILMGSNSEFLKETREMSMWLYVDSLYLARKESPRALQLVPLVQMGPSPDSAKNACYFYSRVETNGYRMISYHFVDQPETMANSEHESAVMRFLEET